MTRARRRIQENQFAKCAAFASFGSRHRALSAAKEMTSIATAAQAKNDKGSGRMDFELTADQLEAAATSAEFITTLFVTFGTFSIFSGILLIFLILLSSQFGFLFSLDSTSLLFGKDSRDSKL